MTFLSENLDKKFTKLDLSKGLITEVEFEECEFFECSFLETKFERCRFLNCKFTDCMISAIDISNSYFSDISFLNSKVIGVDWTKARHVQGLIFKECKIDYSNFCFLKLNKTEVINCEAKEVDFSGCDLTESDFTNTDFKKSLFIKTNLTKANFKKAKNYYIDAKTSIIRGAHFSLPEAMSLLDSFEIIID